MPLLRLFVIRKLYCPSRYLWYRLPFSKTCERTLDVSETEPSRLDVLDSVPPSLSSTSSAASIGAARSAMGEMGERGADFGECEALFFAPPRGDLFSGETACGGVDMFLNPRFKRQLDDCETRKTRGSAAMFYFCFLFCRSTFVSWETCCCCAARVDDRFENWPRLIRDIG